MKLIANDSLYRAFSCIKLGCWTTCFVMVQNWFVGQQIAWPVPGSQPVGTDRKEARDERRAGSGRERGCNPIRSDPIRSVPAD